MVDNKRIKRARQLYSDIELHIIICVIRCALDQCTRLNVDLNTLNPIEPYNSATCIYVITLIQNLLRDARKCRAAASLVIIYVFYHAGQYLESKSYPFSTHLKKYLIYVHPRAHTIIIL